MQGIYKVFSLAAGGKGDRYVAQGWDSQGGPPTCGGRCEGQGRLSAHEYVRHVQDSCNGTESWHASREKAKNLKPWHAPMLTFCQARQSSSSPCTVHPSFTRVSVSKKCAAADVFTTWGRRRTCLSDSMPVYPWNPRGGGDSLLGLTNDLTRRTFTSANSTSRPTSSCALMVATLPAAGQ